MYKIGDFVVIANHIRYGDVYDNLFVAQEMESYRGMKCKIIDIEFVDDENEVAHFTLTTNLYGQTYDDKITRWYWSEHMFQHELKNMYLRRD